jgi:hypothetical protein
VEYLVDNTLQAPGEHPGNGGPLTIAARAMAGYSLTGISQWSFDFTPPPTVVTPAAPTFSKTTGKYTIPARTGVRYYVNGKEAKAGTYSGNEAKVTVTAQALAGYSLSGTTSWSYSFLPVTAAPAAAKFSKSAGTYAIPSKTGVQYYANGKPIKAGTYKAGRTVVAVAAKALPGYKLTGTTSWKYDFRTAAVPAKPSFDTRKNRYTIPAKSGVKYYVNGTYKRAGTYKTANGRTLKVTAKASSSSYRLTGTTVWTVKF